MTTTNQPLDLDAIQQRYQKFDEVFVNADDAPAESLDAAMNSAEDVPALLAEVERLRAEVDRREEAAFQRGWDACDSRHAVRATTDQHAINRAAEVERLRAENETLLGHLGAAADKLLALGWGDVAAQMGAGTYQPAADPNRCRCGAMWGHRHADTCTHADAA